MNGEKNPCWWGDGFGYCHNGEGEVLFKALGLVIGARQEERGVGRQTEPPDSPSVARQPMGKLPWNGGPGLWGTDNLGKYCMIPHKKRFKSAIC